MTIAAILDLDKAIKTFKNTTQKLLELGEPSEWDGQRLKEQEEQIRQVSLELAGQSIGILLQRLSEDPLAQQQANQRTLSSRGFGSQSQGKKKVIVTTVGNVEVPLWIDYVLSRQPQKDSSKRKKQRKPGQRGKSKGQGFYPG